MDTLLDPRCRAHGRCFCGLIPNPLNLDYVVIGDPEEQLLLAPKVQINSSLGDAGMFSDRFYSCRLVSTFGEDLSGGPKNGAAFITMTDCRPDAAIQPSLLRRQFGCQQ